MKKITILLTAILFTALSTMAQVAFNKDNSEQTAGSILHVKGDGNDKVIFENIDSVQIGAYTIPATDGTADQGLVTDGSGAVSWGEMSSENLGTNYNSVVNNTTGRTWMDRNLGASQVATASNDANAYGDLYQWGRASEGHEIRSPLSVTHEGPVSTWISDDGSNAWDSKFVKNSITPYDWLSTPKDDLWTGTASENKPCPSGFRLPTNAELNQEFRTWASQDAAGAFGSPLKLTVGGYRDFKHATLDFVGSSGFYWSSTVDGTNARYLVFSSISANMSSYYRAYGFSIRCIKD